MKVCNQLNVTEVNIGMFQRMIRSGVATNDVRNFAHKQQNLNRQASRTASVLSRVAMKQKLKDAFSTAEDLRKKKKMLKESLYYEHNYSRAKTKRVVKKIMTRANNCRIQQKAKVRKKYVHCKKRSEAQVLNRDLSQLPETVNPN